MVPSAARTSAKRDQGHINRRRHPRVQVGLPVEVHLSGRETPLTVELTDIAAGGDRVRAPTNAV
jgi:c-di-GMP-binding flagellar brake protein YcgR